MIPYKNVDTLVVSYKNGHPGVYMKGKGETKLPKTLFQYSAKIIEEVFDFIADIFMGVTPDFKLPSGSETYDLQWVNPSMPGADNTKKLKGQVNYASFLKGRKLKIEFENDVPYKIKKEIKMANIAGRKINNRTRVRELNRKKEIEAKRKKDLLAAQQNTRPVFLR